MLYNFYVIPLFLTKVFRRFLKLFPKPIAYEDATVAAIFFFMIFFLSFCDNFIMIFYDYFIRDFFIICLRKNSV